MPFLSLICLPKLIIIRLILLILLHEFDQDKFLVLGFYIIIIEFAIKFLNFFPIRCENTEKSNRLSVIITVQLDIIQLLPVGAAWHLVRNWVYFVVDFAYNVGLLM